MTALVHALMNIPIEKQFLVCLYLVMKYEDMCRREILRAMLMWNKNTPEYKMAYNLLTLLLQPREILEAMRIEAREMY